MASYEKATQKYDVLSKEIKVKSLRFEMAQKSNKVLTFFIVPVDIFFSAKETFQVYSNFFDSIRQFENTIEILDIIINHSSDFDPSNVKAAASRLKHICIDGYNELQTKWYEALNSAAGVVTSGLFYLNVEKIPGYGEYIAGALGVYNAISNIDDVAMYYEYTCAKDQIADAMSAEIRDVFQVSKDEKYVYSSSKDYKKASQIFYYLIMARTSAEQDCLNCLKAVPFYLEWMDKDCQKVSENAITKLNIINQIYFA